MGTEMLMNVTSLGTVYIYEIIYSVIKTSNKLVRGMTYRIPGTDVEEECVPC